MKRILTVMLTLFLCLTFGGCDFWMDGSYASVKPHREENESQLQGSIEVTSYAQLQDALIELVRDGRQNSVIYMPGFQQTQLNSYMERAVLYVTRLDAVAAYAVDDISYEIGTNAGRTAIAVDITYLHNRSEILRIRKAENMENVMQVIADALENCDATVVIQVEDFEQMDFTQAVQDYVDGHPDTCMEMPQVAAAVYPESGMERVIEVTFTYQTSRETLRSMQKYVRPVFVAADLNVSGEEAQSVKFARMYSFLMERSDYKLKTSLTPAYSLLCHGVGDSKAFAIVYAAMCRRAGLDCQIVTGTRQGAPWVWNIICEDETYYHVDLLKSSGVGYLEKLTADQMQGYVWDYSADPGTNMETSETAN